MRISLSVKSDTISRFILADPRSKKAKSFCCLLSSTAFKTCWKEVPIPPSSLPPTEVIETSLATSEMSSTSPSARCLEWDTITIPRFDINSPLLLKET